MKIAKTPPLRLQKRTANPFRRSIVQPNRRGLKKMERNSISNKEDMIDIRDVIARFEELEAECADEQDSICKASDDDKEELSMLQKLLDELKGNGGDEQWQGDWYPITLIRDSYFENAMDEMLEDCGELQPYDKRPCYINITVDYKALQMDYSSVEIDGETYWYR